MNYQRIYSLIIKNRRRNPLDKGVYQENHHILPKSMGGTNEKDNLVRVTAKEHYILHHLLYKIYKNRKMCSAFYIMCCKVATCTQKRDYNVNARLYNKIRLENSIIQSNFRKGKTRRQPSQSTKEKIRKANLGHYVSQETKEKIRLKVIGRKTSQESIKKQRISIKKYYANLSEVQKIEISNKMSGKNNPMYGISLKPSQEIKDKISKTLKGRFVGELNWNYGKQLSQEHIEKLKKSSTGKRHTQEAKNKMSNSKLGKKRDKTTIEKMSKYMKGRYVGDLNPRAVKVQQISTGRVFGCIKEGAIELNYNPDSTRSSLNKKGIFKDLTYYKEK